MLATILYGMQHSVKYQVSTVMHIATSDDYQLTLAVSSDM